MSREICESCGYPLRTCVCTAISSVMKPCNIIVIQDIRERGHPKNTLKLLSLIISDIVIMYTNKHKQVEKFCDSDDAYLIYPIVDSQPIEEARSTVSSSSTLIFIDASWKQANAIYHANEWLQKLRCLHFATPPQAQYDIRTAKKTHQLSTIEAVSYSLSSLFNTPPEPFYSALSKLKQNWQKFQP